MALAAAASASLLHLTEAAENAPATCRDYAQEVARQLQEGLLPFVALLQQVWAAEIATATPAPHSMPEGGEASATWRALLRSWLVHFGSSIESKSRLPATVEDARSS